MQLFHIHNRNRLHRLIHSEFWLFEFSVWLHTFSRSLIAIFIPIFLLQIGYNIGEVIFYYFLYNLFDVPLNFLARQLIRKIGARSVIILGSLFSTFFFIGLYNLDVGNWILLTLIAFFAAIYDSFYWVAHLFLFMKCSKNDNNVSGDASSLSIVRKVAGLLAPVFGAGILVFMDRQALIIVSILFLVLSIIPLFKIKLIDDKPKRKQLSFKEFFSHWNIIRDYIVSGFRSVHDSAEGIIWPIFVYLLFVNIESVAVLPIIVSFTTILFTYLAGKVDKEKRNSLVVFGGLVIASVWLLRLVLENNIFYYLSVFFIGLFSVLVSLPIDSYIFEKGEKKDTLSTSTYRNTIHMFSNMIFFGILTLFVNVFNIGFVLAAISMLLISSIVSLLGEKYLISRN